MVPHTLRNPMAKATTKMACTLYWIESAPNTFDGIRREAECRTVEEAMTMGLLKHNQKKFERMYIHNPNPSHTEYAIYRFSNEKREFIPASSQSPALNLAMFTFAHSKENL